MDEHFASMEEGYAHIKKSFEATSDNAKNMSDSFKLLWENIKTGDYSTAAAYAKNLAQQASETAAAYAELAEDCKRTVATTDG